MSEIRMKITRKITNGDSEAMFGRLDVPGLGVYTSLERWWNDNIPGKSAVPPGFYTLERHNGTKYKDTFALIGDTVSHENSNLCTRYACVLHWEDDGSELQGCISIGNGMLWSAATGRSHLIDNEVPPVLGWLEEFNHIYLTIVEE